MSKGNVTVTGITRPIDDLGRVVIPKELRDSLHWPARERIEILTTEIDGENVVVLRKSVSDRCALCGRQKGLLAMPGSNRKICTACAKSIASEFAAAEA